MRIFGTLFFLLLIASLLNAQDKGPEPLIIHLGPLALRPSGFFEDIGMSRSDTSPDSISTKFGNIPLTETPGEWLGAVRPSRFMLSGSVPAGPFVFSGYMESDFMNFTPGQSPYRWRQYWGQAKLGAWEILGGQAWSLLRPNRFGISTDKDLMSTDVIDPNYHVGLLGARHRQIRLSRSLGTNYKFAAAWEGAGNLLAKIAFDQKTMHLELAGTTGRFNRRGISAAGSVNLAPGLRFVTQEFWGKRDISEALGLVAAGINGLSTLEGLEAQVTKYLELYSYAGLVYAAPSAGNRVVGEWTAGFNRKFAVNRMYGLFLMSLQFSHVDRAVWTGKSGEMSYVMARVRYTFN